MTRTALVLFACSILSHAQPPDAGVTATYHFTSPQTEQGLTEAVKLIQYVAAVPQASADIRTATLTFSGPADAVDFAAWVLPAIDKSAGDAPAVQEYKLPKGKVARVDFLTNVREPRDVQALLTILRTVADVQGVYPFTPNHAMVLRDADWSVAFAEWMIRQIDRPVAAKPDPAAREYQVGGPDFRGLGHGARLNFLTAMKSERQEMELLTVLRMVSDVQKIFVYDSAHILAMRAGDLDLERAEWIIGQLDRPQEQPLGTQTFAAPSGDDVTRIFRLQNATPEFLKTAIASLRTDLKIRKIFQTTEPANIVVRGTGDQIAAAAMWMAAHNALTE